MDNKSTTKRMIGAVVLVLIAALLLAWLLKGKNKSMDQQELVAEQTQEAAPILGFPGVNNEGENAQVADTTQEGATQEYAIGSAEDPNAQQQAQGVLDQAATQTADVGKAVGETVAEAVTAGKEVVLDLGAKMEQNNTTGFDVRDSNGEVRQVVADGKVEAGMGSMGANEVSTDGKAATQPVATTDKVDDKTTKTTAQVAAPDSKDGKQAVSVAAGDLKQEKIVNPKLVNEKPVPPPAIQRSASVSTSTSSGSQSVTASSSSSASTSANDATAGAAGRSGYVIQVLATSSKGKADGVRKSIAVDGYPAFVAQAKVDGKTVYRVRVGTYPGKGDASSVQAKMKARYAQNQYVQNSFVTEN